MIKMIKMYNGNLLYFSKYIYINSYLKLMYLYMNFCINLNKSLGAVAIANNQMNLLGKMYLMKLQKHKYGLFINMCLLLVGNEVFINKEGCLSMDYFYCYMNSFKYMKIMCISFDGKKKTFFIKNFLSICMQHEYMHLLGYLIS